MRHRDRALCAVVATLLRLSLPAIARPDAKTIGVNFLRGMPHDTPLRDQAIRYWREAMRRGSSGVTFKEDGMVKIWHGDGHWGELSIATGAGQLHLKDIWTRRWFPLDDRHGPFDGKTTASFFLKPNRWLWLDSHTRLPDGTEHGTHWLLREIPRRLIVDDSLRPLVEALPEADRAAFREALRRGGLWVDRVRIYPGRVLERQQTRTMISWPGAEGRREGREVELDFAPEDHPLWRLD